MVGEVSAVSVRWGMCKAVFVGLGVADGDGEKGYSLLVITLRSRSRLWLRRWCFLAGFGIDCGLGNVKPGLGLVLKLTVIERAVVILTFESVK